MPMNIGQAAAAAAVPPKMIRHYESLGLIPAPQRTDSGYRTYTQREVDMLRFVRQARALGFPIAQVDALLQLWRDDHRESRAVKEVAQAQLADLQQRRKELDQMAATLEAMVRECSGDETACCPILEQLSAPAPERARPIATRSLKEVKAGSRAAAAPRRPARAAATHAHSALEAWSRSAAAPH